jgi:hypothetical protein
MLRKALESTLHNLATITPLGQLQITYSPHVTYTINNLEQWCFVDKLTHFWYAHETLFKTYITYCFAHSSPITAASMYLCGLDFQTLDAARHTLRTVTPNPSFLFQWARQIICFGPLAQCQDHNTITIRQRKLYVRTSTLHYYYTLDDQPQKLLHQTPLQLSVDDVDTLQHAWSLHYQLAPILRKITHKKQITHTKSNDNSVQPIVSFPTTNPFAVIWPTPLRQSFPREFDSPCWCIDMGHMVIALHSFSFPTLLAMANLQVFAPGHNTMQLHTSLTSLWQQYEYLLIQEMASHRQQYFPPNYLSTWCQTTFGISIMATLECASMYREQLNSRYISFFNTCLGAIQHLPQNNVTWCKKTQTLTVYNWKICMNPMPSWNDFDTIPCLNMLTPDERYMLYQKLHLLHIPE